MRCVILVAVLLAVLAAAGQPRWNELQGYTFARYVEDFGLNFGEEYKMREKVFNMNLDEIRSHNADGSQTYKKGVNQFTAWTAAEFKSYNTLRHQDASKGPSPTLVHKAPAGATAGDYPKTVDYRKANAPRVLTGVKNQGACGGCWGFSAL